ncbi:hypothetical protein BDR06DRAFT_1045858, partial [Suillus hirtellus]
MSLTTVSLANSICCAILILIFKIVTGQHLLIKRQPPNISSFVKLMKKLLGSMLKFAICIWQFMMKNSIPLLS